MASLDGKTAFILGAAGEGNMGQVIARQFAREGANVVIGGRDKKRMSALASELNGLAVECDITNREQVFSAVAEAREWTGRLDVGLNATGWGLLRPTLETTEDDLNRMLAIQFKGPFFFFQALLDSMTEGGSIIQISSATATIMLENHAAYMGTKAGIDHVIRTIANEFGHRGIRANSISPGVTETPMAGGTLSVPEVLEAFTKEYPLGRVGTSEDIAHAAVWLARDECFMTGQNLQVNGGLTLRRNPTGEELFSAIPPDMIKHLTQ